MAGQRLARVKQLPTVLTEDQWDGTSVECRLTEVQCSRHLRTQGLYLGLLPLRVHR